MNPSYDTVNFKRHGCDIVGYSPFVFANYLDDVTEEYNEKKGYRVRGKVGDYRVLLSQSDISLYGSLSKSFLPSNIYTLTRKDSGLAIEKLSDQLHIDLKQANITRLDIAAVFPMSHPPCDYLPYLGNKPYFKRIAATISSLYYHTEKMKQNFYDKGKQAKAKGIIIPPELIGCNLLRYELRLMNKLKQQLNLNSLNGAMLVDEKIFRSLVLRWVGEYEAISKINSYTMDSAKIKTPSDAEKAFFTVLLQQQGQQAIDNFIADMKFQKRFKDPKYYTRLKDQLNEKMRADGVKENELIRELSQSIFEAGKYAY